MRALFCLLAATLAAGPTVAQVEISEFLAVNDSVLTDFQGNYTDWIELHNTGGTTVDLTGWYLTDDELIPTLWAFPATSIPASGFLLVRASGLDLTSPELHTSFSLGGGGEYLALIQPDGSTVEDEYAPDYPTQFADISYGHGLDLLSVPTDGHFLVPTPGAPNGTVAAPVDPVEFSMQRGFYDAPFNLALTSNTLNVLIYYTLDGSEPDQTKTLYTGLIPISSTTVVRAAAFLISSESITNSTTSSYIFLNDVVNQTDADAIADGFPVSWFTQFGVDWKAGAGGLHPGAVYGYDSSVTSLYTTEQLIDSLKDIPTMSITMSIDDWFGYNPPTGVMGIYVNSEESGPAWDRKGSAEYFDAEGGEQFQINCGFAIQGGSSITPETRSQLSIAIKIKSDFGPTKLVFPLFDDSLNDDFDYLILDGGNQNSISANVSTAHKKHAQGLRDQYMADLQRGMGGNSFHGDFVHLYINGLYWGMYNLHERPDERWAAEQYGGTDVEYDWVKEGFVLAGNSNPATHPTPGAWPIVNDITGTGLGDASMYGGQPAYDAFQDYVNLADYVDYMNLNFYGGNTDWPHRNWMATSHSRLSADFADVNPDLEFLFHSWDAETCLGWEGVTAIGGFYDRTQVTGSDGSSVAYYYTELQANSEYALRHADRAHAALFNDGGLFVDPAYSTVGTVYDPAFPERNLPATLYYQLAKRVEVAIPMEYSRWGNYFHAPGTVTPADWFVERDRLLNDYFSVRSSVLLAQLKNIGLYPNMVAPSFNQHGGEVPLGFSLAMSAPAGSIYFTTDGSDPRLAGGAINPTASTYAIPEPILALTTVKARAYDGVEWSALNEATFIVGISLRINEIMASNSVTAADEAGQFEDYVEIHNGSGAVVDLSGMYLSDNPAFPTKWQIPSGTTIAGGGTILIWCDEDPLDGPLHASFKLSAGGEQVGLYHTDIAGNLEVDFVAYGPQVTDIGYGRMPDGGAFLFSLLDPSPNATNVPVPGATARYDATPTALNPRDLIATGSAGLGQTLSLDYSGGASGAIGVQVLGLQTFQLPYTPESVGLLLPILAELWTVFIADGNGRRHRATSDPGLPATRGRERLHPRTHVRRTQQRRRSDDRSLSRTGQPEPQRAVDKSSSGLCGSLRPSAILQVSAPLPRPDGPI